VILDFRQTYYYECPSYASQIWSILPVFFHSFAGRIAVLVLPREEKIEASNDKSTTYHT
jgi:hypothetical protein